MRAEDVIESYVHDVARRLPPKKRDDVAFELRALLTDELQGRAAAVGRTPDGDMAVDLLRAFGRPSETAVRYHTPFTIIAPSDTWSFMVAAIVGGPVVALLYPASEPGGYNVLANAAWLGVLVVVFGIKSLILRSQPDAFRWRPHPVRRDPSVASRTGNVARALLLAALLVLYLDPGRVTEALTGGRISAQTLAYSDSFASPWRMPWLVGLLVALIGLHLVVAGAGRWRVATRWTQIAVTFSAGVQLGWHVSYGNIFSDPQIDAQLLPVISMVAGVFALVATIELYRAYTSVRPAPASAPAGEPGV
jgi:hypothetical protein